ncbi:hypothetical protein [uncultured Bifidobacterium sp.]|uniref:hypothetical protein n=1 Tax=uncultured Bifidobacterium sp. TaxID=165187 RepID=UPI0028DB3131|nr:hypothetical protein [uncultured Bifidobacterium sp.]
MPDDARHPSGDAADSGEKGPGTPRSGDSSHDAARRNPVHDADSRDPDSHAVPSHDGTRHDQTRDDKTRHDKSQDDRTGHHAETHDPAHAEDSWRDPDEFENLCALSPVAASVAQLHPADPSLRLSADPREAVHDLEVFVSQVIVGMGGLEGPTFLWNHLIPDICTIDDEHRRDCAVASPEDASDMMDIPMTWYFEALDSAMDDGENGDGTADHGTTEDATDDAGAGSDPTPDWDPDDADLHDDDAGTVDLPVFRMDTQALAGVDAVVGNALSSSRWMDSARNLTLALDATVDFISRVNDDDNEVFDYLIRLIQQIRLYFHSLAEHAGTATSAQAMAMLVDAACSGPMRLNPVQLTMVLSCGLSFARWDDTRVIAYDALARATRAMDEMEAGVDGSAPDSTVVLRDGETLTLRACMRRARLRFDRSVLLLRHDLLRLGGEDTEADRLLLGNRGVPAMADAYAARLVSQQRWDDLARFSAGILRDMPDMAPVLFPAALLPRGWESLHDMALAGGGRIEELCATYRRRVVDSGPRRRRMDVLDTLRRISGRRWEIQVKAIVSEYADGRGRRARNATYERLLLDNGLAEEAWRYVRRFPGARLTLAPVFADAHPEEARHAILGGVGLDGPELQGLDDPKITDSRIIRAMKRYAGAFGRHEAGRLAERLLSLGSSRKKLTGWLKDFTDDD